MGVHDGHRERMKSRFTEHGLDNFDDHSVLELLLFYALPRRDVNPLAHALLQRFGSLEGVFEAPEAELMKVPGIGDSACCILKLIPAVSRRYMIDSAQGGDVLGDSAAAGKYLLPYFMYERDEVAYMVCLDAKCRVLSCREMSRGVVNATEISVRRIIESALSQNASFVILAHNHTGGLALPSSEDESTTRMIRSALELVGITLADHIIVAGADFVSMSDSGLLRRR